MILHTYLPVRNDLYMIRYYVRYYSQFPGCVIFAYDDNSDDGTREFLLSCAPLVRVMPLGFTGIDEIKYTALWESEYKKHSRGVADWVIMGDADEFIYHPNLMEFLESAKKGPWPGIMAQAYQMLSETRPEGDGQIMEYVKTGVRDAMYDRLLFRPEYDVSVPPGKHHMTITTPNAMPVGSNPAFRMLHYRWLGREYVAKRNAQIWAASTESNKSHGWGIHTSPGWNANYGPAWFERALKEAKPCLD